MRISDTYVDELEAEIERLKEEVQHWKQGGDTEAWAGDLARSDLRQARDAIRELLSQMDFAEYVDSLDLRAVQAVLRKAEER